MPTIKDIAREAGVSHGTVSNVLNGKGNVSVRKIQLVEEAARKLGYKINYKAKSLRSGATNSVSIIIPSIESEEYAQMYRGLDTALTKLGYRTHLYTTHDLPNNEKNVIKEIAEERVTGIVTISCLDNANEYYSEMSIPRENILFVNRELPNAEKFISFDFHKAGAEIGTFITDNQYGSVGIFSDEVKFSNEKTFADAIAQHLKGQDVKIIHVPLNQSYEKSFELFQEELPEIIVTSSLSKAYLLKTAHVFGSVQAAPNILSLGAVQPMYVDKLMVYHQNYQLLGREIANLLINQVNQNYKIKNKILLENDGIRHWDITTQENKERSLSILTVTSPTTDALLKLLPHFTKTTGIKASLTIKSYDEIYQIINDKADIHDYDVIRMDMAWLPWFGKDIFQPLIHLNRQLDQLIDELPQQIKNNYSQIEETIYAIPFDPSIQMLFYRKDLFEDPKIKRMYYEKYKKQLSLPKDFEAYNELVQFFSRSQFVPSPTAYGASVTLGKPELIALEFLTRYYALNGKLVRDKGMELNKKKAVKALGSYLEVVSVAQQLDETWWGEAVNSFARGETAMVIGFMNHVSRIAHSDFGNFIGSAPVPGNNPLLGGGVIGISKYTDKLDEAVRFLNWVNTIEIAEQISLLGGTTANAKVSNNQTISALYPWLYEVSKTNFAGVRDTKFSDGKGFNAKQFEQIVGQQIERVLSGAIDAEQAIDQINHDLSVFFHDSKS